MDRGQALWTPATPAGPPEGSRDAETRRRPRLVSYADGRMKFHENRTEKSEKSPSGVRRMFADISPQYDLLNHLLSFHRDGSWRRRAVRELRLSPACRVLDVCTGTADLALELAAGVAGPDGGLVVGADFTPEMLAIARQKCAGRRGASLQLVLADALRLPFPDEVFDAVTVAFGIRNVCDLRQALMEMLRVLRVDGQLAILEFSPPRRGWLRGAFEVYFRRILPRLGAWISRSRSGAEAYAYLPRSVGEFPSPEGFSRLLEECGFSTVRHVALTLGVVVLHLARRAAVPGPAALGASARGDQA